MFIIKDVECNLPTQYKKDLGENYIFVDAHEKKTNSSFIDKLPMIIDRFSKSDLDSKVLYELLDWANENYIDYINGGVSMPINFKKIYKSIVGIYSVLCYNWFLKNKFEFISETKEYLIKKHGSLIVDVVDISQDIQTAYLVLDFKSFNFEIFSDKLLNFVEKKNTQGIDLDSKWLGGYWSDLYTSQGIEEFGKTRRYNKQLYEFRRDIIKDVEEHTEYTKYLKLEIKIENTPSGKGLLYKLREKKIKKAFDDEI